MKIGFFLLPFVFGCRVVPSAKNESKFSKRDPWNYNWIDCPDEKIYCPNGRKVFMRLWEYSIEDDNCSLFPNATEFIERLLGKQK